MSIDRLEGARNLSRNTRDRERWTAEQWLKLYDAYKACGWDITPDDWAWWQVEAALMHGTVPQWDSDQQPIAPEVHREVPPWKHLTESQIVITF